MILSTKYLDNLRPFTKQVKNDKEEKKWKKFEADVWKISYIQYTKIKSSRTSTSLLQVPEKFISLAYVVNFRYTFNARTPSFFCKWFLSIDNSVRRFLLLKIVLHFLFADAIDGLRPNSAYADPFWRISGWRICIKKTLFSFRAE